MPLLPVPHLTEAEREQTLRALVVEGAFSSATTAMTTGVILTAFALHLGASNLMIGVLAATPFLAQVLQAPAITLIERWRARKKIAVLTSVAGRLSLGLMAALAFFPGPAALAGLLGLQIILCAFGAIGSCAWNAWLRDVAPEERLGDIFARRTVYITAVTLLSGLAAALALDWAPDGTVWRSAAFAGLYAIGCAAGLVSARIVARMAEPQMPPASARPHLFTLLRGPFADVNFRRLIAFLAGWQFAVNLATPFFTVFFVRQLGFSMTFVMGLTVVSQVANVVTVRAWGRISDRFSNKSALGVAAPVYILGIAGMIGASQLHERWQVAAWLVFLHLLLGAAVAGVTLATANIALKLSPRGGATAYLAANALISSTAAGVAPILGGAFADYFAARQLELVLRWTSPNGPLELFPLRLSHWDFYFLISAILGLYALHRLSLVREEGEIERAAVVREIVGRAQRTMRNLSTVAGLRALTEFPSGLARDARAQARLTRARGSSERRKQREGGRRPPFTPPASR